MGGEKQNEGGVSVDAQRALEAMRKISEGHEFNALLLGTLQQLASGVDALWSKINTTSNELREFKEVDFREHVEAEQKVLDAAGEPEMLRKKLAFIDTLIEAQIDRKALRKKVIESATVWAVIAFLGYLAIIFYHDALRRIAETIK